MSFAKVHSGQIHLLSGRIVDVEVDLSRGLHSFSIIGLPDKSIEESRDRISAAIKNSGFESPKHKNQKVVISLAPAHVRKEGSVFDLAMSLGYLLASGDIDFDPTGKLFLGELSLDGELRSASGVLPIALEAKKKGFTEIFLPETYIEEAALVQGLRIHGAKNLAEVVARLDKRKSASSARSNFSGAVNFSTTTTANFSGSITGKNISSDKHKTEKEIDLEEIRGQELAKRGLMIAAAGRHNIILYGPPGTGKTMLAKAFRSMLPTLTYEEVLEVSSIHSIAGNLNGSIITEPPFRAPHHSSSHTALIGGGGFPRPGEITLAHRGVLFLDEFPEFERRVIEALRQPLEDRTVSISRAKSSIVFPANIILIATMNPCPCGHLGNRIKPCICASTQIQRYRKKISGPIADRIDLWIEVGNIDYEELKTIRSSQLFAPKQETTTTAKEKIARVREIQRKRFGSTYTNSDMAGKDLPVYAPLSEKVETILTNAARSLGLSMRAYHRVWKLARTIADLDQKEKVEENHILEALQYRPPKDPEN